MPHVLLRSSRAIALAALFVACGAARAAESLPVIVTYEMQRHRDAERAERTDPKAFWIRQIVARIEDAKPAAALGLTRPTVTRVSFVVGRDGRLVGEAAVAAPSGESAADGAALAMLQRAQPFPPMPGTMTETDMAFTLPLRFR